MDVSRAFDDAPLSGVITITPKPTTSGWRYEVDLNEDGIADQAGTLRGPIGFGYSFQTPGLHRLSVSLEGPEGPVEVEIPVAVNDPSAFPVLAVSVIARPETRFGFTGITTSRDGLVYALEYDGRLLEVDPASLLIRRQLAVGFGPLNIAVSPSDTLLYITGDDDDFNLVHRTRWELLWHESLGNGEYFLHPLDDRRVLTSAESILFAMVDIVDRAISHSFRPDPSRPSGPQTWHFDVSPSGDAIAVLGLGTRLYMLDPDNLTLLRTISLPGIRFEHAVAYHPSGQRIYVLGDTEASELTLLVLDEASGRVVNSHLLPRSGFCGLCANTSVMSVTRDGRFMILVTGLDAYFIDTGLDLPRYRLTYGHGVTASPIEDAIFFLRNDGRLTKVATPRVEAD